MEKNRDKPCRELLSLWIYINMESMPLWYCGILWHGFNKNRKNQAGKWIVGKEIMIGKNNIIGSYYG